MIFYKKGGLEMSKKKILCLLVIFLFPINVYLNNHYQEIDREVYGEVVPFDEGRPGGN